MCGHDGVFLISTPLHFFAYILNRTVLSPFLKECSMLYFSDDSNYAFQICKSAACRKFSYACAYI